QLLQEAEVVFVEEAHVVDVVPQHGDALDAKPPREPCKALGIDAAISEHVGVDHAAAAHLEPPVATTAAAAAPAADAAGEIELEAGLCVGEVRRSDADASIRPPERLREIEDGALQVTDRYPVVDGQRLDLHELGQVRRIGGVAPVAAARDDHVD